MIINDDDQSPHEKCSTATGCQPDDDDNEGFILFIPVPPGIYIYLLLHTVRTYAGIQNYGIPEFHNKFFTNYFFLDFLIPP